MRRHPRSLLAAACLLIITLVPMLGAPSAAAAGPTTLTLSGHGYGHGRGLGQYGAKGYAEGQGWSAAQILDRYYGGTTSGQRDPNLTLRVLLCQIEGVTICTDGPGVNQIVVTSTAAFHFQGIQNAFAGGVALKVTRDNSRSGFAVEQATGGCSGTTFAPVGEGFTVTDLISLDPGTAPLQVCAPRARKYRGGLRYAQNGAKTRLVNFVGVDDYLRGVVPSEMPSGWGAEALKAQAVAARSYALAGDNRFPTLADTCDTTQCQVYLGIDNERATTDAAISATSGQVRLTSGGAVARTEFSSSTGGYTAGGAFPAVSDEGDAVAGNPFHNWTATLQATDIEAAYPTIGDFQRVEILERNGLGADGGRVRRLRVVGAGASTEVTGDAFRSKFSLKSDWFTPGRAGVATTRLAGADRFATAVAIAQATFDQADVALLTRGDGPNSFADGLAANYLAGVASTPVLLSNLDTVPQATMQGLDALGVSTVRLLGGTAALSGNVEAILTSAGYTIDRIQGPSRYDTAAAIARAVPATSIGTVQGQRTAVLSLGMNFPDALAAGSMVFAAHFPQLLTETASLPEVTRQALTDLGIKHVIITGGTTAIATSVEQAVQGLGITTERAAGATRYATAVALADIAINRMGFSAAHVDIGTGETYPDALTGGTHAGKSKSTIVLTTKGSVPGETCSFLSRRGDVLTSGHLYGGTAAITDATKDSLESCTRS
jgi:SpoIID/LytB domain protein